MKDTDDRRGGPVRSFVRSAWILLAFQLVAAAIAVGVTGWAALQVRPLLSERERLTIAIAAAEDRVAQLAADERRALAAVAELEERAAALRDELKGARDATPVLTEAIEAFHEKNYASAVTKYDEALEKDPGNAYIYNLKSYSQFKAGDLEGATRNLSRALQIDPSYTWGYFDLARYQCASGAPQQALDTIERAVEQRGAEARQRIEFFLTQDGEFNRLCRPIRSELRRIAE